MALARQLSVCVGQTIKSAKAAMPLCAGPRASGVATPALLEHQAVKPAGNNVLLPGEYAAKQVDLFEFENLANLGQHLAPGVTGPYHQYHAIDLRSRGQDLGVLQHWWRVDKYNVKIVAEIL